MGPRCFLVSDLVAGFVHYWPAVAYACEDCAFCATSVALVVWAFFVIDCLPSSCGGLGRQLFSVPCAQGFSSDCWAFCGSVLLLMPPCPLVATSSLVFAVAWVGLRSSALVPSFLGWGSVSLLLGLFWLRHYNFVVPSTLGSGIVVGGLSPSSRILSGS